MQLVPDPRGRSLRHLRVAFFPFRVVSRISHLCAVGSETQARCSIVWFFLFALHYNAGCVIVGTVLRALTAQDTRAMERTETWGRLFFFLVQYAVHKSLALQILRFLLFLLLLNGYIAVFFPLNLYEQLKGLVLFFFCFSFHHLDFF